MAKGDYVDPIAMRMDGATGIRRRLPGPVPRQTQQYPNQQMGARFGGIGATNASSVPLGTVGTAPSNAANVAAHNAGIGAAFPAGSYSAAMSAGGGAAMSGGGMPSANGLYQDYQNAYQTARQANENRYAQGLQGYTDRYNRGMGMIAGLGNQELADIRQSGEDRQSSVRQRMTDLGLGGTTVGDSLAQGAQRETNADLGRAQERIRQQQAGTDAQLSGDALGFLERRTDAYPDMGSYMQLMQMAGQHAARSAGGAGSPVASGGYGAASSAASLPPGQTPATYGASVINNDTGLRTPRYTRQPGGGMSAVYRTDEEDRLARNPFLYG